jgi:hypothetical protein
MASKRKAEIEDLYFMIDILFGEEKGGGFWPPSPVMQTD